MIKDLFMLNRFHQFMPSLPTYYFYTLDTAFYAYFLIRIYRYTCTYLCTPLGINVNTHCGVFDSPGLAYSGSEAWIEVEPSTEDQTYLSEKPD